MSTPDTTKAEAAAATARHTPGPWKIQPILSGSENDKGWSITANDIWIAEVSPVIYDNGNASEEGKANVALIAQAPALLEACQRIDKLINNSGRWDGLDTDPLLFAIRHAARAGMEE